MDIFTVSLFGHREIGDLRGLEDRLLPMIKELMREKEYVAFLIGRNGEFDEYAASLVKRAKREIGEEKSDMTLVLPYSASRIEDYERYYDSVILPESVCGAHPKAAITLKNKWMVERSDLVIVYVERNAGGAYQAMRYAQRIGKDLINLFLIKRED